MRDGITKTTMVQSAIETAATRQGERDEKEYMEADVDEDQHIVLVESLATSTMNPRSYTKEHTHNHTYGNKTPSPHPVVREICKRDCKSSII